MHFFMNYVEPLITWLRANPTSGISITFIISFAESLAIIGSIVPGSVTMTAIGILAGSGVMRIDLTIVAAVLGAICGDGASYMLGYIFRDKLPNTWIFKRYPLWLSYGKKYFERHGGKSVLIGRFFGPLRSIIPVIAGMMHMDKIRFFLCNVISGIVWSLIYIVPGILIGAESDYISHNITVKWMMLLFVVLVAIWVISLIGKRALLKRFRKP